MTSNRADSPAAEGDDSPLEIFDENPTPSRVPRVLLWTGLGVVILAGAYVAAQWAVADKVPDRTTVAGVEIGGLSRDEAIRALDEGLAAPAARPIAVVAGEQEDTLDPVAAGLSVDARATVADLTGFDLAPNHLWNSFFGGSEAAPVVEVDDSAFDPALESLATRLAVAPVDGAVFLTEGSASATDPVDGQDVDLEGARRAITEGWLLLDPIELPVTATPAEIGAEATAAALAEAKTLVSAPVTVAVDGQVAELPTEVVGDASEFTPTDGALELSIDADAIRTAVLDRTIDLEVEPENAHFEFEGGKPTIVGGRTGAVLEASALAEPVREAALSRDDRTAAVELTPEEAEQSAEKLEALGIQEIVSEFSTPLGASNAARIHNLTLGAERVTGELILPDETWSLTEALGPITAAGGYREAGIVNNGQLTDGVGGGLSQMATTTYNAGFFAGYEDVEHRPHSYYFSRYPEGREATIFVGSIDMRFRNDTPYGALMQAFVRDGEVTVRIWSTKHFEVQTSTSARSNVRNPTTEHSTARGCIAQPAGSPGFTVTVDRTVTFEGEVDKQESNTWTYRPQNSVVCDSAPSGSDDD